MFDFLRIGTRCDKHGATIIYPKFVVRTSSDLMIRGGDFYAIWVEERGLWSTSEQDAIDLIDRELDRYAQEHKPTLGVNVRVQHIWDAETGMIDAWHKYCRQQMWQSYHQLDDNLIFSNTETTKMDYASKKLSYPLEAGECPAFEKLISTLYSPKERHKLEWAIGAVVSGDSKTIQKFMVLYGAAGTGKSTILNIIQQLFKGYDCVFDAKALGSSSNAFALEAFRGNPLVAIQHDGDLSRIEDNTRINSLVSHESMPVNEKYAKTYTNDFKCFLFMGTNKPVKITDAKSGIIRRLIDVSPSGNKLDPREYKRVFNQVSFELGAIACHCRDVYLNNPGAYDDYVPTEMMGASNDFYNFILDAYYVFKKEDGTTLKAAWEMYRQYCEDAKITYPFSQRVFKEELKNYFRDFKERYRVEGDTRIRNYYSGFITDKFENQDDIPDEAPPAPKPKLIEFDSTKSIFDRECAAYFAQYATAKGTPMEAWDTVTSKLYQLDTSKLHYVRVPENHIVIDFDIQDADGNKSYERNVEEASKWPPTYAELSKSGCGVHLHYIYNGDVSKLSRIYDNNIEVKAFTGKSSLRRKLTKCNNLPIATISSGLPLKGDKKLVNPAVIQSENGLRAMIRRNLEKEIHPGTKPSIDFIYQILEDAYSGDLRYDVTDMRNAVIAFAANSTHQADYCLKLVDKMKFKSEEPSVPIQNEDADLVFYDVEVFPNLFLVNWKRKGKDKPVVRMINPTPTDIEELIRFRLVGFNCRRYDNHILYGRLIGYSNEQLYKLSQKIVSGHKDAFFSEAYNISYTDIYDFASAGNKKSLKKLEIEMGIHHQELGLPWDQPVPEEKWVQVAEYCDNDVIATEAAFDYLSADWTARQILADLADMTVNDTTNSLTTKIIFGNNRNPQNQFHYRNLAEPVFDLDEETYDFLAEAAPEMMEQTHGEAGSLLPYFDGYTFEAGKSIYRDEEIGEGGKVYAEPGMYTKVALLDIMSQHPHSIIAEVLFGVEFTRRFREIVVGRVSIKHEAWEEVNKMLDGKLTKYIQKVLDGEMTSKQLADALKTAINSVYGLTSAAFPNPFKDPRNKDNIVAKRGALFMTDLKYEVQKRGFTVAHIKTDSIKIPNATPEIIQFVMDFGKKYGYYFEHEATYDRMCLVNDAVYIAKYENGDWTATGAQFAVPYLFKTLFSKEDICFEDMCETNSVTTAIYLDMNEGYPDVSREEKVRDLREKIAKTPDKKLSKSEVNLLDQFKDISDEQLAELIGKGHNYHFIGRVGQFCPMKPGCGGGVLLREKEGKYYAVGGSKGYRWLESEMVKTLGKENDIDRTYYDALVTSAATDISKYGDFEWFVSDDVTEEVPPTDDSQLPWLVSCGKETCVGCPNFTGTACELGHDVGDMVHLLNYKE